MKRVRITVPAAAVPTLNAEWKFESENMVSAGTLPARAPSQCQPFEMVTISFDLDVMPEYPAPESTMPDVFPDYSLDNWRMRLRACPPDTVFPVHCSELAMFFGVIDACRGSR